jgi:hypothetical protein
MIGHVPRSTAGFAFHAAIWVGVACCGPAATAAQIGTPLFGQAGAALVPGAGAGAAMKQQLPQGAQKMADNFNKAGTADAAPAAGGPAAAAAGGSTAISTSLSTSLMKYGPSYVLMALAIALGMFVVCRPAGFSLASLAEAKKPKK